MSRLEVQECEYKYDIGVYNAFMDSNLFKTSGSDEIKDIRKYLKQ